MAGNSTGARREERIDVSYDYEVCVWARHFNTTQQRVRDAVKAVGNRADRVRDHLAATAAASARAPSDRPSGN